MKAGRVGTGLDVHAFTDQPRPLVLAGVEIPGGPGLAGHSDADVAAHALTDALLGALGAGDLGTRFGTNDPDLEGASSLGLLAAVVEEVEAGGYAIGNVDLTLVAERPRLGDHRQEMIERLAQALGVATSAVSVKITSSDGLGAIGRGEGIGCWAICLLVPR